MVKQADTACVKTTLLTIDEVLGNLKTYYMKCNNFRVYHRNQDHHSDIHNFRVNFFTDVDFDSFNRELLEQSVPISSIVTVFKEWLDKN